MGKNTLAFVNQSQENFAKFMDEASALSTALENTPYRPLGRMLEELMEVALRIRTLRQYCLNGAVSQGGTMMVNAERVIQILDGA
jgi:hypothetical protein